MGYKKSWGQVCALATNKMRGLPQKRNIKNYEVRECVQVDHPNDKSHHGDRGTMVGMTADYVHIELYLSCVPHEVICKHNESIKGIRQV